MAAISIHTDGAARGNPGLAAIAFVIEQAGQPAIEYAQTIGQTTNNQAEYQALRAALTRLADEAPSQSTIECFADSELMIKQLRGEYKMKNADLRPHWLAIQALREKLLAAGNSVMFTAVRREANRQADALCNQALDAQL